MNHKYTLACNKCNLFGIPKRHFLIIDRWVIPQYKPNWDDTLILTHGILSEMEYRQIISQDRIMIFQNVSLHWIGLYSYHESKRYQDDQYIGDLVRFNEVMWMGCLHVR